MSFFPTLAVILGLIMDHPPDLCGSSKGMIWSRSWLRNNASWTYYASNWTPKKALLALDRNCPGYVSNMDGELGTHDANGFRGDEHVQVFSQEEILLKFDVLCFHLANSSSKKPGFYLYKIAVGQLVADDFLLSW
jgi:hypothetical protein